MNNNDAAIEQYKEYIVAYPENANAYANLAVVYERVNNLDLAIANYKKSLAKDNTNNDVKKKLARCYHTQKDYANALKYYDEILAANPDDYDTKANKALVLHAMEKYDEACVIYKELIEKQPNERLQANLISALIAQGNIFLDGGQYAKALPYFNDVISYDINESCGYYGLAKAYENMGSDSKATENYEKAIDISPDNAQFKADYEKFVAKNKAKNQPVKPDVVSQPSPKDEVKELADEESLIKSGDGFYNQKKYDDAIKKYTQATKIGEDNAVTYLKLGNLYKIKKDATNSSLNYQKALKIDPTYTDAWFNLGLVYAEVNNYADSKKCFARVINLNPNYAYAYYAMALAYEAEQNNVKAIEYYQSFIKINKDEKENKAVVDKINSLR